MAIVMWPSVTLSDTDRLLLSVLDLYPYPGRIYLTSGTDGQHGAGSYHYGGVWQGSPCYAIDIGAGGVTPLGDINMRDIAKWLYDNFWDLTVELIHTTPFDDDQGFYVKNQVRYPGGGPYAGATAAAHRDHVHWASSDTLITKMLSRRDILIGVGAATTTAALAATAPPPSVPKVNTVVLDYIHRIDPVVLSTANVSGVCRYLSYPSSMNKIIGKAEFEELLAHHIAVTLNWEWYAQDALGGATKGTEHGLEAVRLARALGLPGGVGATIPGSADWDMTWAQYTGAVRDYYRAYGAALRDGGYGSGGYGSYDFLTWAFADGLITMGWQSMSTAFSQGRNANPHPLAHLWQRGHYTVGGQDTDRNDILKPSYGQYLPGIWPKPIGALGSEDTVRERELVRGPGASTVVGVPWDKGFISFGCDFGTALLRVAIHVVDQGWLFIGPDLKPTVNPDPRVVIDAADGRRKDITRPPMTDRISVRREPASVTDPCDIPITIMTWEG